MEFQEDTGSTSDDKMKEKIEERELTEICEKTLEKDDECLLVFYEIMKGNENRKIAKRFGISNSQTAVIKKRMMRKLCQMVPEYYD